jgi:hypothetical protein
MNRPLQAYTKGIHNLFNDELIPDDAFSEGQGWITKDGAMEIARGKKLFGNVGVAGTCAEIHTAYKVNGTPVYFKKVGTVIQTLVGDTWTDVITGLTEDAPTTFSNYSSLAGAFLYIFSTDGIYKIVTANPTSYTSLYNEAINFKGIAFIDKGRSVLWGREKDKTGLYGSHIDAQNSTVYTTVSSEAITDVASGTLAFKAGGATRTCFAVQITDTSSSEVFTDNYDGTLTGSAGSTGTINYTTGAFTITGQTGAGTANYLWEDSNDDGVTDFTKSVPRVASEGFQFPQDIDGDAIKVVIPYEGTYFSFKERSVYSLVIGDGDTSDGTKNEVFRTNIGVPTSKSVVATSKGIIYVDTANSEEPALKLLAKNPLGDTFDTQPIFAHFKFNDYDFTDASLSVYGNYVLIACREKGSGTNDVILLGDYINNTVDVLPFRARCFTQYGGNLYAGDSVSTSTYQILNGFDDDGYVMENYIVSKGDTFGLESLKKEKRLRFRGLIGTSQSVQVYGAFGRSTFTLLGTIYGNASYVNTENPNTIGLNLIGIDVIGGSDGELAYPFFCEIKIKTPKFRKRNLKFVATGFGYVSIQGQDDRDIWIYEDKMPKDFRQKQNISLDGTETDLPNPDY